MLFVFLCNFCHYSVPVLQLPTVLLSWHLTKCELNWSCSVGSQNSSGLTWQILFICCSVRNFLTIWYVLSMSAFCVRLYRAVWKLSRFDVLCKLFGIILVEYSTNGTICTVFSCHIHISSSFISYHYYFGLWSIQFLFTELRHFSSTNYCVLFIAWQVKCFGCPPQPTHLHMTPKCYYMSKFLFQKNWIHTTNTILPPPILSVHCVKPTMNIDKFTDNSFFMENWYIPHQYLYGLFVTLVLAGDTR